MSVIIDSPPVRVRKFRSSSSFFKIGDEGGGMCLARPMQGVEVDDVSSRDVDNHGYPVIW
jgi:hypothetical protein